MESTELKTRMFINSLENSEVVKLSLKELLELEIWIEDKIEHHEKREIKRKSNIQFNTY